MRPIPILLALLTIVPPGCGEASPRSAARSEELGASFRDASPAPASPAGPAMAELAGGMMGGMMGLPASPGPPGQEDGPPLDVAAAEAAEGISRKIIYDAQIDLLVEDLDPVAGRVVGLVEGHGGYIAEQDLSGSPGSRRSARWTLRVPVERFEDLVQGLLRLGELERNRRTSQDVSEQFYDIEARVRNKEVEESTLLEILEERGGKLEDVLKVEVELSRVRGEIEQLEGRLRVLDSLSSLATITLGIRERDDYEPTPPVSPSFRTKVAREWASSIDALVSLGESLVLLAVGLAPWLPLILALLVAALLLLRRLARALPRLWELARRPLFPPREPR
ncbi:DUF4349 domain-containing protein [Tautonia plasticadhaerens]|uniref:DUF4349 domain-containing protein n=1 Tax=Tautonia plasticadhaerens TaxID=2527974 RepID=A0A518HEA9_9BACT|nr:DUF4349 domain-containing protein [Tautonia plasticadhaerens]QDV39086.1 hypothetical protein ElP_70490 [Tautonia plasticadhaerens]